MAQDFRHGHGRHRKPQFQRKSQQKPISTVAEGSSVSKVWAAGFLVSALFLVGFFVTQHFVTQAKQEPETPEASIFKTATDIKEKAIEKVAEVSEKLEPKKVVVEAVEVKEQEKLVEVDGVTTFSFYEGLAKTEVVVDAVPISIQLERPYYIQAGTFGSEAVAMKEKARLARLGQDLEVSVYQGTKQIYYRLRVGPYTDRLELNKKRNELRRLGVDTLLVKAPKPAE